MRRPPERRALKQICLLGAPALSARLLPAQLQKLTQDHAPSYIHDTYSLLMKSSPTTAGKLTHKV